MKLKKINRGLVLGAVLIAGTSCYVAYDNSRFQKSKPDIEKTVNSYFQGMIDVNMSGENIYEEAEKYVNSTWVYDSTLEKMYYNSKKTLISEIDNYYTDRSELTGGIQEYDISIGGMSIKKNGPNGAVVTLSLNTYIEFNGSPASLTPDGFMPTDNENYVDGYPNTDERISYTSTTDYLDATVYLRNTDDGWKITAVDSYSYIRNVEITEDGSIEDEDVENTKGGAEDGE